MEVLKYVRERVRPRRNNRYDATKIWNAGNEGLINSLKCPTRERQISTEGGRKDDKSETAFTGTVVNERSEGLGFVRIKKPTFASAFV